MNEPVPLTIEECLDYFRKALAEPDSVLPWADWWTIHADWVERTFPMIDYVRLKHRGLLGAEQILHKLCEHPKVGE